MSSNEMNISTERLVLRGIRISDAESIFRYRSSPKVYEFQFWKPQTLEEVMEFIINKTAKLPNIPNTWYQLGILLKDTNELIGDIGVHFMDDDSLQAEVGYTLSLEYQSKGYATEAVTGVINYLFNDMKKHRVIASVDPRNTKSIALLEKIGMRKEAHFIKSIRFNNEWADDVVYAVLCDEWKQNKALSEGKE